jgi:hypothetical protein
MKIAPKQYHKNPRQITTKQMTRLALTLEKLGDLSGIVHELNTNALIGGNQRGKIFRLDECEIVLTDAFDEPDNQGTVGLGYAIWHGKKYAYRQVRWDAKTAEEANVTANKGGGTFDFDILANEFEIDDLLEWGFEFFELGLYDDPDNPPSLDDLESEYGENGERDFWPFIKVQVSPETFEMYESLMAQIPGTDEAAQVERLLGAVDATVLGAELP